MRLRSVEPGPETVVRQLHDVANRTVSGGGEVLINAYLAWVNEIERILCAYFADPNLDQLFSRRHWYICEAGPCAPRLHEVVDAEVRWQARRLNETADGLDALYKQLSVTPARPLLVLDTNVFLHCQPPDEIDWAFVSPPPIRLVVPLRVIEELDEKKRDRNADVVRQARKSTRWLRDRLVLRNDERRHELGDRTTLEAYVPFGPRVRELSADSEILIACEDLSIFSSAPVAIATADLSMQLRGAHWRADGTGFIVHEIPAAYQLP